MEGNQFQQHIYLFKFKLARMKQIWLLAFLLVAVLGQVCQPINQNDCGACENNYFFDGKCLPCAEAKDEYSCELCKGFYFRQGKCLPCSKLTNPGLCQQCRGYFFSDGQCLPCQLAPPYLCTLQCPDFYLKRGICSYCGTAADQLTCKFCPAPFQFKNGKCQQCPKHYTTSVFEFQCMSCAGVTNSIICSRCPQFYFTNNTCTYCRNATNARQCSLCTGFYFQGGACKHCSEAGKKDCGLCKGFVLQGQQCVECKLVNNSASCQNCPMYRYSTDRDMCVPCQQKGYFLNENGYCQHCLTAYTQQTCDLCPRFIFDKRSRTCSQCSEIKDPDQCTNCIGFYFQRKNMTCQPCANASMINCLLYCDHSYFYSRNTCKRCEEAQTQSQCKLCGQNHFWTESGKCMRCSLTDFYVKGDKCASCSSAKTAQQCNTCPLYTFSNGKCKPCKYASNSLECSNCRSIGYYFTPNNTCSLCELASQQACNPINCPSYGYHNGSCLPATLIMSQAACLKFPFFSWTKSEGCRYCAKQNEYYNPSTESCTKCQYLRNFANCSHCPTYYFNQKNNTCLSCSSTTTQQSCGKCVGFAFVQNRICIPCGNLTKKSDCAKCPTFFYRKGQCQSCSQAISLGQCKQCRNHAFQNLTCIRCEKIQNMARCEKQCGPQGYYAAKNVNLCLPCDLARDEASCSFCPNHIWNQETKLCSNCSSSPKTCQKCAGMYWNTDSCKPCLSGCKICTNRTTCLQCKPSFSLSQNKIECEKVCKAQFCHKCRYDSMDFCEECKPDYDFSGIQGICSINCMVSRCLTCKSNSVCQICEKGYILQQQGLSCRCSIDFCDSCETNPSNNLNTSLICNRCMLGYVLNDQSNACLKINCQISNCQLCRTEERCDACKFGWKLSSGICRPICNIQGCGKCSSAITCELCEVGFKLISQKSCEPICNISNCQKCASFSTCLLCKDTFQLSENSANCTQNCIVGFYEIDNICVSCEKLIPNCQNCQLGPNQLICKKCQPTFTFVNGQCASCTFVTPNCVDCQLESFTFVCHHCSFGYSPISKRCRKCADNCISCEEAGEDDCDTCIDGYTYSMQAVNYIKCLPCMNNCKTCEEISINNCTSCYEGQLLKNGNCLQCLPNCKKCLSQNTCSICQKGYLLGKQGCILKKIQFCKTEIVMPNGRFTDCLECLEGYYLIGGSCLPIYCSSPEDNCTSCPVGRYLSSGQCLVCPSIYQCYSCNPIDPSKCLSCMRNYYLQKRNGQCYSCMAGCDTCSYRDSCNSALPGYYLLNPINITVKCPFQCAACTNDYFCTSCANGYRLYRHKCISSKALSLNITVKPNIAQWDSRTKQQKFKTVLLNFYFLQAEIIKLIGYDGREQLVHFDTVATGSIMFSLIIDKLPSENGQMAIYEIESSIYRGITTFKVISFKLYGSYSDRNDQEQSFNHFLFAVIGTSSAVVLCILALFGIVAFLCRLKNKVAIEPAKQLSDGPTYNHLVKPEKTSEHSSDKDEKTQGKSEEPTENLN